MATFIQINERAGVLILAAVALGAWFVVAPDHATATIAGLKEAIMGVLP